MKFRRSSIFIALAVVTTACGPRLPSQDDGQDDDAVHEDLPPPGDLPCGGADLMTDNDNCGSCGNECNLSFEDTQFEAGGCLDGQCGPNWSTCLGQQQDPGYPTCTAICEHYGDTCVPEGCAGVTGLMVAVPWFGGCDILEDATTPIHACDEELEYFQEEETHGVVKCCCSTS